MTAPARTNPLLWGGLLAAAVVLIAGAVYVLDTGPGDAPGHGDATVTFNRDIAPIVFRNCIVCHRPG